MKEAGLARRTNAAGSTARHPELIHLRPRDAAEISDTTTSVTRSTPSSAPEHPGTVIDGPVASVANPGRDLAAP